MNLLVIVLCHSARLPYVEAVILEVQWMANLAPLTGRWLDEDMIINGYTIPKGTTVVVNLLAIHKDPRLWKNPEEFDPTRFLDEDGKLVKPDAFNPFSFGTIQKRQTGILTFLLKVSV